MKNYTLVVVDMLPIYEASNDPDTQKAVAREIRRARDNDMPIIFLEVPYWSPLDETGYPPTHKSLMKLVKGYGKYKVCTKHTDSGSQQVLATCKRRKYSKKRFRVCGVNTDFCVLQTVCDLHKARPKARIKVIKDACNSSEDKDCWDKFPKSDRVILKGVKGDKT